MSEPGDIPVAIPEEGEGSEQPTLEQLNLLRASATKEYSLKNYSLAAELYSEATEIQAQLNGELNPDNADLLYQYGRCLYHVAVSKSDVLGGKVASNDEPAKKKRKTNPSASANDKSAEDVAEAAADKDAEAAPAEDANAASKPFFQITGDENWTDSEPDDDDAADAPGAEDEEDDDDFAIAYEILDVARLLLTRKLESLSHSSDPKGKAKEIPPENTPEGKQIMERLADTHDLQAEISLENERFADAVADEKASLELKKRIFPTESSLVAEAHYKLSLALEFASVTQPQDGAEAEAVEAAEQKVDEGMREESVQHMEAAIASCKLRVDKETESLAKLSGSTKREKEASIKDVKEMIGDMEQRLLDLRNPSLSLPNGPGGSAADAANPLGGILGSLLGESKAEQKAKIAEATKTANDLTGLVTRKKKKVEDGAATVAEKMQDVAAAVADKATNWEAGGKGKRKADEAEVEGKGEEGAKAGKKVKFDE